MFYTHTHTHFLHTHILIYKYLIYNLFFNYSINIRKLIVDINTIKFYVWFTIVNFHVLITEVFLS